METVDSTDVETETLTAVQVGLLTIYDMWEAIIRRMVMTDVLVLAKDEGKSGNQVAQSWAFDSLQNLLPTGH